MIKILLFTELGSVFGKRFIEDISSYGNGINIVGVITRTYKDRCDYYQEQDIDITRVAGELSIPIILQTDDLKQNSIINCIKSMNPDYIFVCNYRLRLPEEIINTPKFLAINFHPSLLPQYAGLSPFFWMTRDKITESGVSAITLTDGFDEGLIIAQIQFNVSKCKTNQDMMLKHFEKSYLLLSKILDIISSKININSLELKKQSDKGSYFSRPQKEDYTLKLTMKVDQALTIINCSYGYPYARLNIGKEEVKIIKAIKISDQSKNNGVIKFDDGYLEILEMSVNNITYTGLTAKNIIDSLFRK